MFARLSVSQQWQTAIKHIMVCCGLVGLSLLLGIVGLDPHQKMQAPAKILPQCQASAAPTKVQPKLAASYGKLPLSFEANQGQTESAVKFVSRGSGYTLFLTGDEAVLALRKPGVAQGGAAATRGVGPSGAGPGPNAIRPYNRREPFAAETRIHGAARQQSLLRDRSLPRPLLPASLDAESLADIRVETPQEASATALRMRLVGANSRAAASGADELPGKSNYFIGNDPKKWRTNVPTYAKVKYAGLYPGVDLVYYGNQGGELEYDFVVAPGADPNNIKLDVGAVREPPRAHRDAALQNATDGDRPRIAEDGDLIIPTDDGEVRFHKPVMYQETLSETRHSVNHQSTIVNRKSVDGRFTLDAENCVRFALGPYDHSQPLVIDPVLVYSTYLGDSVRGGGYFAHSGPGIAVDSSGNVYVTGTTRPQSFPVANPFQPSFGGGSYDAFVAKLSWNGSALSLAYSTYLGGSGNDYADGIAVDSAGNAYVTGYTYSSDFPVTNPFVGPVRYGLEAFVVKLNPTGNGLAYSTWWGGSSDTYANAIAVDSSGNAYVTGTTASPDYPTLNPIQSWAGGNWDAFVTKLNSSGLFAYSTLLGGSDEDYAAAIALDSSGNAYVTGWTSSTDFPLVNPFQATCRLCSSISGETDAFVAKLNATGSALVYSTYLGGAGADYGYAIAVDASGNAVVTGDTASTAFPLVNPLQPTCAACTNEHPGWGVAGFVTKFNSSGSALIYSTYLGSGGPFGLGESIAVDTAGNTYVSGSTEAGLPAVNSLEAPCDGAFIAELNNSGSAFSYSTYLCQGGADAIAVDSSGNAYITGETSSTFPTVHALQGLPAGGNLVAKLSPANLPGAVPSTGSLSFGPQILGGTSAAQTVTITNFGSATLSISSITTTGEFAEVATCGPLAPLGSCMIPVTFTPNGVGTRTGTLTITDNDGGVLGSTQTVSLTGTGVAPFAGTSPTSLDFGPQALGTASTPQAVTLTDLGSGALTVNLSISSYYSETDNCGAGLTGNGSCTINVTFKPTKVGWLPGQLAVSVSSNGVANPAQYVALSGSGSAGPYTPNRTFFGAGSSAIFNSFALAAGLPNAAGKGAYPLCGYHHWTQRNGAQIVDPRSPGIAPVVGDIWIAWDDDFLNRTPGSGTVCFYIATDSVISTRAYFAQATAALVSPAGTPDGLIVPLLVQGEALPQPVADLVNGALLNVAITDLRPEDAKFATIRALTAVGTRIPRTSYMGAGYGPFSQGAPIQSAWASQSAQPVDFVMAENEPDPFTGLTPRSFATRSVGASPVLVIRNVSQTGAGHLGNTNYQDINRTVLGDIFTGQDTHIRQISRVADEPDNPIHVWQREPLSGTFNTMEFCILLSEERWPTLLSLGNIGQETGVDPTRQNCTVFPCAVESGNPFYHCGVAYGTSCPAGSATRGRAIGDSQMVAAVDGTPDSIGYAFWGFGNFSSTISTQYMTVDGLDPLYASPAENPGGPGVIPACGALPCPPIPFTHIVDGSYPIWSVLRMVYDNTDPTVLANGMDIYAEATAGYSIPDFLPFSNLQAFRSHFGQLISSNTYDAQYPNNGTITGIPETGGDMGGAVLTIQSDLDFYTDTGSQQINERQ